jgi:hypothetical protein
MLTLICWGVVMLGVVLDALCIRDDGRLCPWRARLMAIWNAPR